MMRVAAILLWLFLASQPGTLLALEVSSGAQLTQSQIIDLVAPERPASEDRRVNWHISEPKLPMTNSASGPVRIELLDSHFDRSSGRLRARLAATLSGGERTTLIVVARANSQRRVAVPAVDLPAGHVIATQDLDTIWIDDRRLDRQSLTVESALIGMEVKRRVRARRPIRANMLRSQRLIERGELVEVVYARGGLQLSMVAEATEDASRDQWVRLRNLDSGQAIVARTVGPRLAVIDRSMP